MIKTSKKNGFTLIECMVAILCDFIVMSLVLIFLQTCLHITNIRTTNQDQMAILQLRQLLAMSSDVEASNNSITFINNNEEYILRYDRNRIVQNPGYEIWMENVKEATMYEKDEKIFIRYKKNKGTYIYQLY